MTFLPDTKPRRIGAPPTKQKTRFVPHQEHLISRQPLHTPRIVTSEESSRPTPVAARQSRHFCATSPFCACFRHAMISQATRAPTAVLPFTQTKQRRARFVAGFSERHRKCGARLKRSRTNAFRVTILPPPRAKPPPARPAMDRFGWSFFGAGEGFLPHVLPARITLRFPNPWWSFVAREASE